MGDLLIVALGSMIMLGISVINIIGTIAYYRDMKVLREWEKQQPWYREGRTIFAGPM
jgi:hypothetical protein